MHRMVVYLCPCCEHRISNPAPSEGDPPAAVECGAPCAQCKGSCTRPALPVADGAAGAPAPMPVSAPVPEAVLPPAALPGPTPTSAATAATTAHVAAPVAAAPAALPTRPALPPPPLMRRPTPTAQPASTPRLWPW